MDVPSPEARAFALPYKSFKALTGLILMIEDQKTMLVSFAVSDIGLTEDEAEYEADLFLSMLDEA